MFKQGTFRKGTKVSIVVTIAGITTREPGLVEKVTSRGIWLDNGVGNDPSGPFNAQTGEHESNSYMFGKQRIEPVGILQSSDATLTLEYQGNRFTTTRKVSATAAVIDPEFLVKSLRTGFEELLVSAGLTKQPKVTKKPVAKRYKKRIHG